MPEHSGTTTYGKSAPSPLPESLKSPMYGAGLCGHRSILVFSGGSSIVPGDQAMKPLFQERRIGTDQGSAGDASESTVAPSETAGILASIGEASYQWDLASDVLSWSPNVGSIVASDLATIATGRLYARLLDPDNVQTRF